MDINKIVNIIRNLNEEVPTNSVGAGNIAGVVPGEDPPVYLKKRKKTPKGHVGSRVPWLQYLRNK